MKTKNLCVIFFNFNLDADVAADVGHINLDYSNTDDVRFYNKLRKRIEHYAFDVIEWQNSIDYYIDVTTYD